MSDSGDKAQDKQEEADRQREFYDAFVRIEVYKGVDIYYSKDQGKLTFQFEGTPREIKYMFEARNIIDEPRWEPCDLHGFYVDYSLEYHIGLAKAARRDAKSGRPDWQYNCKYTSDYGRPRSFTSDATEVYPMTNTTERSIWPATSKGR